MLSRVHLLTSSILYLSMDTGMVDIVFFTLYYLSFQRSDGMRIGNNLNFFLMKSKIGRNQKNHKHQFQGMDHT